MAQTNLNSEALDWQRRAMRDSICCQTFGCLGTLALQNGLILLYMRSLGVSDTRIIFYLSLPMLINFLTTLPGAWLGDVWGKKKVGLVGVSLIALGFAVMIIAGFRDIGMHEPLLVLGISTFALGVSLMGGTWFALLSPVVPQSLRGRFFGRLRFTWQSAGIVYAFFCYYMLSQNSPVSRYQLVLGVIFLALLVRIIFYVRIPEVEQSNGHKLGTAVRQALSARGYLGFCCYVFLICLATAGAPAIFGLIEKNVLAMGDDQVVWLGNSMMIGAVVGYLFGGRFVDRFSSKPVFLIGHFSYALIFLLFISRYFVPIQSYAYLGVLHFLFGLTQAAVSIAVSTDMLNLIPPENKSFSTSLCVTLQFGGQALSGLLVAAALKMKILANTWQFMGNTLTAYDTILLGYGVLTVILVITLGLIPSVISKAQWVPRTM